MTLPAFGEQPLLAFLLEAPLYERYQFEGSANWVAIDFLFMQQTYDNFCVNCKRDSTFEIIARPRPQELKRNLGAERLELKLGNQPDVVYAPPGVHSIQARCTREKSHNQHFLLYVEQHHDFADGQLERTYSTIQKIGQYPSYADVHVEAVKKYAPVLSKPKLKELVRAIGLASHGVGIGSYVYLRRIFEGLIEDAHLLAKTHPDWDEAEYDKARMTEKIAMLRSHLPSFLVEHPRIYSLLSKGVHELSEDECLADFPTLRIGIELILDESLARKEQEQKVAEAKAALSKLGAGGA